MKNQHISDKVQPGFKQVSPTAYPKAIHMKGNECASLALQELPISKTQAAANKVGDLPSPGLPHTLCHEEKLWECSLDLLG